MTIATIHVVIVLAILGSGFTSQIHDITDRVKCAAQNAEWPAAVSRGKLWAIEMLDSSAKIQSGILHGNLLNLGDYDQCLSVVGPFQTKYCFATVQINAIKGKSLSYKFANCIPNACDARELEAQLNETIRVGELFRGLNVKVRGGETTCQDASTYEDLGVWDYTVLGIFLAYLFLVIIATTTHVTKHTTNRVLVCFSMKNSFARTFRVSRSPGIIHSINGLRVLAMFWIVLGHTYSKIMQLPVDNFSEYPNFFKYLGNMNIYGGLFAVDTFFFIGGVAGSYTFLKLMSRGVSFNVPMFYVHRYLRLTPVVAILLVLQLTIIPKLATGPLWPSIMFPYKTTCEKYWWSLLLYVQNYVNPSDLCVPQSWYISIDMQLFVISPLIFWPLYKRPRVGLAIILVLTVISTMFTFYIMYDNGYGLLPGKGAGVFRDVYIQPYTRAAPWLFGLATGYYIYETRDKVVPMCRTFQVLGWFAAVLLYVVCIYGAYPFLQTNYPHDRFWTAIYESVTKLLWSALNSWIVVVCFHGYGGVVEWILGCGVMQVLARFTYSLYVFHYMVVYANAAVQRDTFHFDAYHAFYLYFGDLLTSMILAVAFYLLFELPLALVFESLFKSAGKKSDEAMTRNERVKKISIMIVESKSEWSNGR